MSTKVLRFVDKSNDRRVGIKCYSFDSRDKRVTRLTIKYKPWTTSPVTNTNDASDGITRQYTRDSFNRFGDDLCELLLTYLPFEKKLIFECVCRQWRQLIFNGQHRLVITNGPKTGATRMDSIDALIVGQTVTKNKVLDYFVNTDLLALLLTKCPKITEIYINFNKRYSSNKSYKINGKLFEVLISYAKLLKKITICSDVKDLSEEVMHNFGHKFCESLTDIRLKYLSDKYVKQLFQSTDNFRCLKKLDFNSIGRQLNEDMMTNFAAKSVIINQLQSIKYKFNSFDGLQVITRPDLRQQLHTLDIVLDAELNSKLTGEGVNQALIQLSELKNLEIFNIKIYVVDEYIRPLDSGLQLMAKNCCKLKRLDFIMDSIELNGKLFDIFSCFRSLEFCEISIEYNENIVDYGQLKNFAKCKNLRVFNLYLFNISDNHLVDIDLYVPNMTNFHLRSNTAITDKTLNYLQKCCKLEVFEVHTYNDKRDVINITDTGISKLIDNCSQLRYILIFSRLKNYNFNTSIIKFIEKAKLKPKVKHCFGSSGIVEVFKNVAKMYRNSIQTSVCLPHNIKFVELPDWTTIKYFEFNCNESIPK